MTKKLSLVAALATATLLPSLALADHDRRYDDRSDNDRYDYSDRFDNRFDNRFGGWMTIGTVGTHSHDAEDYVPVDAGRRLEAIELTATGRAVRLDDVQFQLADGRIIVRDVNRTLRDGESIRLDVPEQGRVKMLVLDYANRGPFYRGHEDARVEVRGLEARDWKMSVRDRRVVPYRPYSPYRAR